MKPTETTTKRVEPKNSTDASMGQPIGQRVQARRAELCKLLDGMADTDVRERADVERAIASADALLMGDPEHPTETTSSEMARWLEANKHLAEKAPKS